VRGVVEAALLVVWVLVVVSPCHTLVHELSHGLAARAFGGRDVTVRIGGDPPRLHLSLAGVAVVLHPWPPWLGRTTWAHDLGNRAGVIVASTGPLVSLLLALGGGAAAAATDGWARRLTSTASIYAFWGFVLTAVPWRYPGSWRRFGGSASDGYLIYRALRDRRRAD
jgi:hypothetical protein